MGRISSSLGCDHTLSRDHFPLPWSGKHQIISTPRRGPPPQPPPPPPQEAVDPCRTRSACFRTFRTMRTPLAACFTGKRACLITVHDLGMRSACIIICPLPFPKICTGKVGATPLHWPDQGQRGTDFPVVDQGQRVRTQLRWAARHEGYCNLRRQKSFVLAGMGGC